MPSYDQGSQAGAKQGTRYLAEGTLAVDLSQYNTDFVAVASYATEDPCARLDVAAPRTIHAQIDGTPTAEGVLFHHDNASTGATRLEMSAGGTLRAIEGGTTIGELAIDIPNGRTIDVAWVSELNPETTGDADAVLSWLLAYDHDDEVPYRAGPWAHAARATDDTSAAAWGADPTGADAFTETLQRVSFHDRAWTLAEIVHTWVSPATPHAPEVAVEHEPLPLTLASGIGDRSERQGPPGAWAAHSLHQLRRRTVTGRALVLEPVTLTASSHTGNAWTRPAVGSSAYWWRLGWLWPIPVAPTVDRLWVRVHADLWVVSGAAVPVGLRVYSCNRPPVLADPAGAESYDQRWIGDVFTRDDGEPGAGAWTLKGLLPIRRGTEGLRRDWTYVLLAYAFDPAGASGNDANARLRVNAVQLAPCYVEPEPGGPAEGGEAA